MTEAEFWELVRRAREQGIPLNETQKEAMRQFLRERLSPDSVTAFENDFVPPRPPPPEPPPWWKTPKGWFRLGGWTALIYLLIATLHDTTIGPPTIAGGAGPCNLAAGTVSLSVDPSAPGPNGALLAAIDELEAQCTASGLVCAGGTCPTCAPGINVQTVEIKSRIFWHTAVLTADCECWC